MLIPLYKRINVSNVVQMDGRTSDQGPATRSAADLANNEILDHLRAPKPVPTTDGQP